MDLWLQEFYGLGGFIICNSLWPYGFRLERGFVLAGYVACHLDYLAGFKPWPVLDSPWIWVFSECGSSMVLGLH